MAHVLAQQTKSGPKPKEWKEMGNIQKKKSSITAALTAARKITGLHEYVWSSRILFPW